MKRTRTIVFIATLLFIGGLCVTAVTSYLTPIGWSFYDDDQGGSCGLRWEDGYVMVYYFAVTRCNTPREIVWDTGDLVLFRAIRALEPRMFMTRHVRNKTGLPFQTTSNGYSFPTHPEELAKTMLQLHSGAVIPGLIAVLLLAYRSRIVRWRRIRNHLCANCGYDSRGNVSHVCPECGSFTPANLIERRIET